MWLNKGFFNYLSKGTKFVSVLSSLTFPSRTGAQSFPRTLIMNIAQLCRLKTPWSTSCLIRSSSNTSLISVINFSCFRGVISRISWKDNNTNFKSFYEIRRITSKERNNCYYFSLEGKRLIQIQYIIPTTLRLHVAEYKLHKNIEKKVNS